MNDRDKYINHLKEDVESLENEINNKENINKRNKIIKKRLKTGLTITFMLPAICSSFILLQGFKKINSTPFKIDKVPKYAKITTIDTSTNHHTEEITYVENTSYSSKVEHSTAWKLNENKLYEREVSVYRFNEDVKNIGFEELLNMSEEEINQYFTLEDKQIIQKLYLEEDDKIYNEDLFLIKQEKIDKSDKKFLKESTRTNVFTTLEYIIFLIVIFNLNKKSIKKSKIYKKIINNNEKKYKEIEIENLDEIKEIIRIRKENMELFDEPKKNIYIKR